MNNIVEKFKKGSKIHIKESQKGSFTRWCGGNVTSECIQKGKNSSNPKIRKKATFADNARHFKHKKGGKAFYGGVNILDSNPKMYKKRMVKALDGTKLNSYFQLGKDIFNTVSSGINEAKQMDQLQKWKNSYVKAAGTTTSKDVFDEANQNYFNSIKDTDENVSQIVSAYNANKQAELMNAQAKQIAAEEADNRMMDWMMAMQQQKQQNNNNLLSSLTDGISNIFKNKNKSQTSNNSFISTNKDTTTYTNGTGSLNLSNNMLFV